MCNSGISIDSVSARDLCNRLNAYNKSSADLEDVKLEVVIEGLNSPTLLALISNLLPTTITQLKKYSEIWTMCISQKYTQRMVNQEKQLTNSKAKLMNKV